MSNYDSWQQRPMHASYSHQPPPPPQSRPRSMIADHQVNYPPRPAPMMTPTTSVPLQYRYPPPVQVPSYASNVSRSSSASPTRRPLPAVATPTHISHPVKHQSIDLSRLPHPQPPVVHPQSSFVQMQAQRLQQYQQQQQQQQQQAHRSRSPSPVKRRPSPPRFYPSTGISSNPPSPTKAFGYSQQTLPTSTISAFVPPRSHGQIFPAPALATSRSQPSPTRSEQFPQHSIPVYSQPPPPNPPLSSPTRSQPLPFQQPPQPPVSQPRPGQSQLQFAPTKSRLPNPILDLPSPNTADPSQKFVPLWKRNATSARVRGVNESTNGSVINSQTRQMNTNSSNVPSNGSSSSIQPRRMDRPQAQTVSGPEIPTSAFNRTISQPPTLEKPFAAPSSAFQSPPAAPRRMERNAAISAPGIPPHLPQSSAFQNQHLPQPQQMSRNTAFSAPESDARGSNIPAMGSPERGRSRPLPSAPSAAVPPLTVPLPPSQITTRVNPSSMVASQSSHTRYPQQQNYESDGSDDSDEDESENSDEDRGGFVHYLQQRQPPQETSMDRRMGASEPGYAKYGGGPRGPVPATSTNMPHPPTMSSATQSLPGNGISSTTLQMASMSLDRQGGEQWPQDLPRLPRGPGSGFSSNGGSSIRQASPREIPNLDDEPPPSRPLSAASSAASSSAFGYSASRHSPSGSSVSPISIYQPQPQPPLGSFLPAGGTRTPPLSQQQINIESPKPLGGRDRVGQVDVKRIGKEAEQAEQAQAASFSAPGTSHGLHSQKSPAIRPSPTLPLINISGTDDVKLSGGMGPVPVISISGDEQPSRGPIINVAGPEDNDDRDRIKGRGASPPKIVFEVPGISIDNGSSGIPRIAVSSDDDDANNTPTRRQRPLLQQQQQQLPQPKPRGLICGGCHSSIVGRIVAAMGMKWHPGCFRCCVCDELLEHVSSFEGKDGRPYCHLDYHEAFAPRCYHCETPIVEERFISLDDPALGKRTYHEQHFFCSECGDPFLSPSSASSHNRNRDYRTGVGGGEVAVVGDGFYEDDDVGFTVYKGYPYCEACHVRLRLPKCRKCKKSIRDHVEAVEALGGKWCWGCFCCAMCDKPFEQPAFYERDKKPYCEACFSVIVRNEV
ncbi:hypothetical protein E1B28_005783 [Marasmius oreades]|uniref:LIM zinc-binding domain-containing protein n=1 Tax=Marasmius oreades TaxID=181124 RepID=A0A9P7S5C7_9AGAR|nr:uncharacterized protein E1B28_005783 [Marasmius oreades]KAG7094986.1 hypothetical protein E1B28_005783 [Marasmius oreades]